MNVMEQLKSKHIQHFRIFTCMGYTEANELAR